MDEEFEAVQDQEVEKVVLVNRLQLKCMPDIVGERSICCNSFQEGA